MADKREQLEIENIEHDKSLGVKKVMPYGWDGSNAVAIKVDPSGAMTEFAATSINIAKSGAIKTITETDGVYTRTTTIDATDPDDKDITVVWS